MWTALVLAATVAVAADLDAEVAEAAGAWRLQKVGLLEAGVGAGLMLASVDPGGRGQIAHPVGYGAGVGIFGVGVGCVGLSLPLTRVHTFRAARSAESAGHDLQLDARVRQIRGLQAAFWGSFVGYHSAEHALAEAGEALPRPVQLGWGVGSVGLVLTNVVLTARLYDDVLQSTDATDTGRRRLRMTPHLGIQGDTGQPIVALSTRW